MHNSYDRLNELSERAWVIAYFRALAEVRPGEAEAMALEAVARLRANIICGDRAQDDEDRLAEIRSRHEFNKRYGSSFN